MVIFPYRFWVSIGTVLKSGCQGTTWTDWVGSRAPLLMSFTGSVAPVAPSWSRRRRRTRTVGGNAEEERENGAFSSRPGPWGT